MITRREAIMMLDKDRALRWPKTTPINELDNTTVHTDGAAGCTDIRT